MTPIGERDAVRRLLQRLGLGPRRGELDTATAAGFDATLDRPHDARPGRGRRGHAHPDVRRGRPEAEGPRVRAGVASAAHPARRLVARPDGRRRPPVPRAHDVVLARAFRDQHPEGPLRRPHGRPERDAAAARHRRLPRSRPGDGRRPRHADLARRRRQPGRQAQREPRARVHGAVHARGGQLHRGRRARRRPARSPAGRSTSPAATASLVPRRHDPGPETVLGRSVSDAPSLVDELVALPVSPQFVAGRVWTRFVSDTPPDPATLASLVAPTARTTTSRRWCGPRHPRPPSGTRARCSSASRCCGW